MESIVMVFVHIIICVLVFLLLYWIIGLICSIPGIPPPLAAGLRICLYVLLALFAIMFLLGEIGLWGDWGYGYHHGHRVRVD